MNGEAERSWFIDVGDGPRGPYAWAEIQGWIGEGRVTLDHLCWKSGMTEWVPISHEAIRSGVQTPPGDRKTTPGGDRSATPGPGTVVPVVPQTAPPGASPRPSAGPGAAPQFHLGAFLVFTFMLALVGSGGFVALNWKTWTAEKVVPETPRPQPVAVVSEAPAVSVPEQPAEAPSPKPTPTPPPSRPSRFSFSSPRSTRSTPAPPKAPTEADLKLKAEVQSLHERASEYVSRRDYDGARKYIDQALAKSAGNRWLTEEAKWASGLLQWITLTEKPDMRFVIRGAFGGGDKQMISIDDQRDRTTYRVGIGGKFAGDYTLKSYDPKSKTASIFGQGKTYTIFKR